MKRQIIEKIPAVQAPAANRPDRAGTQNFTQATGTIRHDNAFDCLRRADTPGDEIFPWTLTSVAPPATTTPIGPNFTPLTEPDAAEWTLCETTAYQELTTLITDAQEHRNVAWVVGGAGIGKTTAARAYAAEHDNVFVICCSEDMHRGDFIRELARVIGIAGSRESLCDKLRMVTDELQTLDHPLLIFDEGDKLTDSVFYYFISIYNALEGHCGMLFLSTEYIRRRMETGLSYNKKGYGEMFSRIGRQFVELTPATAFEVSAVCRANGLESDKAVSEVLRETQGCEFDMRRVKKAVRHNKRIAAVRNR